MTDGSAVTCRRCGFANQGGDQFCGSCGAFLEWEGEAADGAAPAQPAPPVAPPGVGPAGDEGLSGLVRPAGSPAAGPSPQPAVPWTPSAPPIGQSPAVPAPPAGAVPAEAPAHAATPGAEALLRCPACGIANAGTRTFCQSCGTRLAETSRVAEVSREQIAAAVAAPAKPRTVPVAGGMATRDEPAAGGSRGIAGWIVAMALLGIVIGVGIVAASVLLRSPGPGSAATSQPSAGTSAGPGSSPGTSPGPGATDKPGTTGTPATAPPTPAATAVALVPTGAAASSVVGGLPRFAADKAIDGDYKTCWQEGAATEKGQWIEVTFAPSRVEAVVINNGYGASAALYKGNHRPKVVRISVDGGEPVEVTLKDASKSQRIELGPFAGATTLRITIVSVYPAVKTSVAGTPFDDAALGEITVIGVPGG